jgi:hypothetical protein
LTWKECALAKNSPSFTIQLVPIIQISRSLLDEDQAHLIPLTLTTPPAGMNRRLIVCSRIRCYECKAQTKSETRTDSTCAGNDDLSDLAIYPILAGLTQMVRVMPQGTAQMAHKRASVRYMSFPLALLVTWMWDAGLGRSRCHPCLESTVHGRMARQVMECENSRDANSKRPFQEHQLSIYYVQTTISCQNPSANLITTLS